MEVAVSKSSLSTKNVLISSLCGAVTFPAVLGLGQLFLFKPLRISCGSPVASVCGGASVLVAGCLASVVTIRTVPLFERLVSSERAQPTDETRTISLSAEDILASAVASTFIFRALGGRFSSVLPSHLLRPGSFAREWISARSSLATEKERLVIQRIGQQHGCHSCGKRRVKQFNADHQPPNKLNGTGGVADNVSNTALQKLYPQCKKCSGIQGSLIAKNNISHAVLAHPLSLRLYHVFLPIPFAIAYFKYREGEQISKTLPFIKTVSQTEEGTGAAQQQVAASQAQQVEKSSEDSASSNTSHSIFSDSNITSLAKDFPLFIIWNRVVSFLVSFKNAGDAFHITLWAFGVIAALGGM